MLRNIRFGTQVTVLSCPILGLPFPMPFVGIVATTAGVIHFCLTPTKIPTKIGNSFYCSCSFLIVRSEFVYELSHCRHASETPQTIYCVLSKFIRKYKYKDKPTEKCHVFAYNRANACTSVLKDLTFPKYEFGKWQYPFTPGNYLVSARKKNRQKCKIS